MCVRWPGALFKPREILINELFVELIHLAPRFEPPREVASGLFGNSEVIHLDGKSLYRTSELIAFYRAFTVA